MPKEKNKPLNIYYLELLKYLVIFKFKNRLGLELSTGERDELAAELKEYNTKDSLNRIFSQGEKRRQNFNKSNLLGLCWYVGYDNWEKFIEKEYQYWAESLEEKLYSSIDTATKKKINKTIFIRILQEIEGKIINGIIDYFKVYILNQNTEINEDGLEKKIKKVMRLFEICVAYLTSKMEEARLMIIYKIAQNIDENRHLFEGFELPEIFKNELHNQFTKKEDLGIIQQLINEVDGPLDKEIMRLYRNSYSDYDIMLYLNFQGIDIDEESIKLIRWRTADKIFNQLKLKEDGRKLLQN